jgi:peptidoglycan-associated lipoprotein
MHRPLDRPSLGGAPRESVDIAGRMSRNILRKGKEPSMFHRLVVGLCILVLIPCLVFILACAGKKASTPQAPPVEAAESETPDDSVLPAEEQSTMAAATLEPPGLDEFVNVDIYFDKGSESLLPQAKDKLLQKAQWLKDNPDVHVVIQGHSDEPGTAEYNFALGDRRAGKVKSYLIGLGIAPTRMAVVSYGKEHPAVVGEPSQNRRVHFEVETLE